jgi:hypothetical protein
MTTPTESGRGTAGSAEEKKPFMTGKFDFQCDDPEAVVKFKSALEVLIAMFGGNKEATETAAYNQAVEESATLASKMSTACRVCGSVADGIRKLRK